MRMKNWKRVTAGALSICMLATCAPSLAELGGILQAPVMVHAKTGDIIVKGDCGDHAKWNYNRTTKVLTITGSGSVYISYSNSINRYKTEIKKLVCSKKITKIESSSFEDFTALEEIDFGGVKKIESFAFKGCTALKSLHLDKNIEEIEGWAFEDCKNLTAVTVGPKVKTVYEGIFDGCKALSSISISKQNKHLYTRGKKLLNKKISGKCGKNVTFSYNRKTKTLTLSGSGAMYDGKYYEDEDFYRYVCETPFNDSPHYFIICCEMEHLVVGDKITSIGDSGFQNCISLKTVKLGKKVRTIGEYAFAECWNLKKINSSTNLSSIGSYAFWECRKLKDFPIGRAVKSIGAGAFSECESLRKLSVHKSNPYFSNRDNMLLNKSQSELVSACFGSNKTCNIYGSVKKIDNTILEDTSVKRFSVSKNNAKYTSKNGLLYSKNRKTLKKCPAKMSGVVNIDNTATSIDTYAFTTCNQITQINIGKNMKKIDLSPGDFSAKKLKKIKISNKNKYYYESNGSIIEKASDKLFFCYKINGNSYTIPDSVKKIGNQAFRTQKNLKHLILSDNITKLNAESFDIADGSEEIPCVKLESIHLGKRYMYSDNTDFPFFTSLKKVTVSEDNPNYISIDGVLYNKDVTKLVLLPTARKNYSIPESVTSFRKDVISESNLRNLTISDTITDITDLLTLELVSIHIGKNVNKLRHRYTPYLNSISVSEENTTFKAVDNMLYSKDGSKFIWCPSQTKGKVVLENGVTEIAEDAFDSCDKITDIVIPDTVSKVDDDAFGDDYSEMDSIVIWVPKGKKDYYKSLFTKKTGFTSNMVIAELEN